MCQEKKHGPSFRNPICYQLQNNHQRPTVDASCSRSCLWSALLKPSWVMGRASWLRQYQKCGHHLEQAISTYQSLVEAKPTMTTYPLPGRLSCSWWRTLVISLPELLNLSIKLYPPMRKQTVIHNNNQEYLRPLTRSFIDVITKQKPSRAMILCFPLIIDINMKWPCLWMIPLWLLPKENLSRWKSVLRNILSKLQRGWEISHERRQTRIWKRNTFAEPVS